MKGRGETVRHKNTEPKVNKANKEVEEAFPSQQPRGQARLSLSLGVQTLPLVAACARARARCASPRPPVLPALLPRPATIPPRPPTPPRHHDTLPVQHSKHSTESQHRTTTTTITTTTSNNNTRKKRTSRHALFFVFVFVFLRVFPARPIAFCCLRGCCLVRCWDRAVCSSCCVLGKRSEHRTKARG